MADGRINIQIILPSVSLKRFVERALSDPDFFAHALENPFGAFREAGVNLDARAFIPGDFARFFATLERVRQLVFSEGGKPTFEAIFGQLPRIRGAALNAEIERGFFREWDMREAVTDRMKCFSAQARFETGAERGASSAQDLCQTQEVQRTTDFVGRTVQSSETFRGQNREWDNVDSVQSRRSDTNVDRSFAQDGQRTLGELMNGPLIFPEHLARLTERLDSVLDTLPRGEPKS
jgi:hypothetical protein